MPGIEIPESFKKRLNKKGKKHPELVAPILDCVNRLGKDPRHPGLHSKKVKGVSGVFESRVDGANRVTWEWVDGNIRLRNHCNHDIVSNSP